MDMDLVELRKLVRDGENDKVEFKRKIRHPEKVIREVVAFANSDGGHLLVGVEDNGDLPGLKFAEEEEYVLSKAIHDLCRPDISFTVESIEVAPERSVLHYYIAESEKKPHFAFLNKAHRFGKVFVRVGDRSIQASKEFRKLLKGEQKGTHRSFNYGKYEKLLLNYLGSHEYITLKEFCAASQLSIQQASDVVIDLALNHVIKIVPREQEDWYVFADS